MRRWENGGPSWPNAATSLLTTTDHFLARLTVGEERDRRREARAAREDGSYPPPTCVRPARHAVRRGAPLLDVDNGKLHAEWVANCWCGRGQSMNYGACSMEACCQLRPGCSALTQLSLLIERRWVWRGGCGAQSDEDRQKRLMVAAKNITVDDLIGGQQRNEMHAKLREMDAGGEFFVARWFVCRMRAGKCIACFRPCVWHSDPSALTKDTADARAMWSDVGNGPARVWQRSGVWPCASRRRRKRRRTWRVQP